MTAQISPELGEAYKQLKACRDGVRTAGGMTSQLEAALTIGSDAITTADVSPIVKAGAALAFNATAVDLLTRGERDAVKDGTIPTQPGLNNRVRAAVNARRAANSNLHALLGDARAEDIDAPRDARRLFTNPDRIRASLVNNGEWTAKIGRNNDSDMYVRIANWPAGIAVAVGHTDTTGNVTYDWEGPGGAEFEDANTAIEYAQNLVKQWRCKGCGQYRNPATAHTCPTTTTDADAGADLPTPAGAADDTDAMWADVVFMENRDDSDAVFAILDNDGPDAAIEYLKQWDYGDETTDAAAANNAIYPTATDGVPNTDTTYTDGTYSLSYNRGLGYIGLRRNTPVDPSTVNNATVIEEHPDGTRSWHRNGLRHRDDGPAIEHPDGARSWWRDGELHRDDGPAIERADGSREWWRNGKPHRDDGPAVESNGSREWFRNGELHRDDGPAIETASGTREWWRNGKPHRDDGPAIEHANGARWWWRDGELHRDDGPAIERADGTREWWRNGKPHRDDGPAVEYPNSNDSQWWRDGKLHRDDGPALVSEGDREWFRDGVRHRDDGPAMVETNGTSSWFRDGKLHRDDGPAVETADGYREWFRNGKRHRDDGPAVETVYGDREWWRDGVRVEPGNNTR